MINDFIFNIHVYYEDTDAAGVVYHSKYLNFMERARTSWLHTLGYSATSMDPSKKLCFVVKRAELEYLCPAKLNDELIIVTKIVTLTPVKIIFQQDVKKLNPEHFNTRLGANEIEQHSMPFMYESNEMSLQQNRNLKGEEYIEVCRGVVTIVHINDKMKPMKLPRDFLEKINYDN